MSLNEKTAAGSVLLIMTIMVQFYNAYPTPDLPLPLLCFILWVVVVVVVVDALFCCCCFFVVVLFFKRFFFNNTSSTC